jgi:transposase InsO family protein
VRYEAIRAEQQLGPVSWLCAAVSVSRSGYYTWRRRTPSARSQRDRRLLLEVRASYEASGRVYGSPRVTKDLRAAGYAVGENRVARLMRDAGIVAVPRRRRRPRSPSDHGYPITPNVLERGFTVATPKGVGRRHHVHPHGGRLALPGGGDGCLLAADCWLACGGPR